MWTWEGESAIDNAFSTATRECAEKSKGTRTALLIDHAMITTFWVREVQNPEDCIAVHSLRADGSILRSWLFAEGIVPEEFVRKSSGAIFLI
jgi:hypothetical protein